MAGQMYFGNRNYMQWIKCPDTGLGLNRVHWNVEGTYLNGGGYARGSLSGHLVYNMAWNLMSHEQIRQILDYRDGVFGEGHIYFLDPFIMNKNVLPQHWATPALAGQDGQPLTQDRPVVLEANPAGGRPAESAQYVLNADTEAAELWVPVPDGYAFHFAGLISRTGTAALRIMRDSGTSVEVIDGTTAVVSNTGGGVTLSLVGTGTITIQGMVAKVLPVGQSAEMTFMSGWGHSGCAFTGDAAINGYSAVRDQLALSVTLKEVGAWDE